MKLERREYGGWEDCLFLSNGEAELAVTTAVGPRIIRYGLIGSGNELGEIEEDRGLAGGERWRMYGGHRLWHAPEDAFRTYQPDNGPIEWEEISGGVRTIQPVESRTGIGKEMEITLSPRGSKVSLLHRLTNRGDSPVELAVWAITVMAPGGREFIPQPPPGDALLPNRVIALWPYSRLDDPRLEWGKNYIALRQQNRPDRPFKLGVSNPAGRAAYLRNGHLFIKRHRHQPDAVYPDFGVSFETYTNAVFLEMETLSPLVELGPGASVEHREEWELFADPDLSAEADSGIQSIMKILLQ